MMADCAAQGVGAHRGQDAAGIGGGDDGEQLAFVRDVERIEAEDFAGAFDLLANRDAGFVEQHAYAGALGDFA